MRQRKSLHLFLSMIIFISLFPTWVFVPGEVKASEGNTYNTINRLAEFDYFQHENNEAFGFSNESGSIDQANLVSSGTIEGVETFSTTVPYGVTLDEVLNSLGGLVTVTVNGGTTAVVPVIWSSVSNPPFDSHTPGEYEFTGTLVDIPSGLNNNNEIDVVGQVTVLDDFSTSSPESTEVEHPILSKAYITSYSTGYVDVVNLDTNTVEKAKIRVGNQPNSAAINPNGTQVFVTNRGDRSVSVINPTNDTVIETISVGTSPHGVVFNSDGSKAYVANQGSSSLSVINTRNLEVEETIAVPASPVALVTIGEYLYFTSLTTGKVIIINMANNTISGDIEVGTSPYGLSVNTSRTKIYVANQGSRSVSVIDVSTRTVEATIEVGSAPSSTEVTPDGSRVYVANAGSANVSVIDTTTNSVIATIAVGTHPYAIGILANGSKVYTINFGSSSMSVIDTATNTVIDTLSLSNGPFMVGTFMVPTAVAAVVEEGITPSLSSNATLRDLKVNDTTVIGFEPDLETYAVSVANDVNQLVIEADTENAYAVLTLKMNGHEVDNPISLQVGENIIEIVVTAQDGTLKIYTITVTRSAGNNNGVAIPTPPTTTPIVENVIVTIEAGSPDTVSQTSIIRTRKEDGTKSDKVTFDPDKAKESVLKTIAAEKNSVRIVIPDANDDVSEVNVDIPEETLQTIFNSNVRLEIFTDNGSISIPHESLSGIGQNIYFNIVPFKKDEERKQIEDRAKLEQVVRNVLGDGNVQVLGRPMSIETNMPSGKVGITLPLDRSLLPIGEKDQAAFLEDLAVYIEHSDGDRVLVQPTIVEYSQGKIGLSFTIEKFSIFTIVQIDNWSKYKNRSSISFDNAYITGYSDGSFKPNQSITRAEMAAIIQRIKQEQSSANNVKAFSDVKSTLWAVDAINYVASKEYMVGNSKGLFQPNENITRAEMATVITRLLSLDDSFSVNFHDVEDTHWAKKSIEQVFNGGYMNGYPDGSFKPEQSLTRAEAVTIFNRILGRREFVETLTPSFKDVPVSHWAFQEIEAASRKK
ncbi:S-layer homology domain-containing protein [Evansella sp. AB-rgal1]|uniref:S-layer homology domain-containing protein n=1 Tax=Evansella sp. AB-rgal1 TaxID=3242696 RepID=UPI00359E0EF5